LTLTDQSLTLFSEEVASRKPAPGGGSVSAYMGALGGSLVSMVARISLGRKTVDHKEKLERILEGGERLRRELLELVVKDTSAFESLMRARKLPKDYKGRDGEIQDSTVKAAEVPLETMEKSVGILRLTREIAQFGTSNALSDVITAAGAARGAVEGAASNVMINLGDITDSKFVESASVRVERARKEGLQLESETMKIANSRLEKPALLRA
jgi:glutamate formiminotransferase / formiminotetrahydrofolate cyclodeaminase